MARKRKPRPPSSPSEPLDASGDDSDPLRGEEKLTEGELAMLERNETLQHLIEQTIQIHCSGHFARRDLWNKQLGDRIKERLGLESLEGYEIDAERGVLRPHSG